MVTNIGAGTTLMGPYVTVTVEPSCHGYADILPEGLPVVSFDEAAPSGTYEFLYGGALVSDTFE